MSHPSHARVTPESRRNNGERLETRDKRLEGVRSVPSEPFGRAERKSARVYKDEKRALLKDLAETVKRASLPPIPEGLKDILATTIGALLAGGYDLALVRSTALAAALDYTDTRRYSKLSQLRMRVRAAASEQAEREHAERMREERRTADRSRPAIGIAETITAMEGRGQDPSFLRSVLARRESKPKDWRRKCSECWRTATYGTTRCVDHG